MTGPEGFACSIRGKASIPGAKSEPLARSAMNPLNFTIRLEPFTLSQASSFAGDR
jgi:hypothetical protein